ISPFLPIPEPAGTPAATAVSSRTCDREGEAVAGPERPAYKNMHTTTTLARLPGRRGRAEFPAALVGESDLIRRARDVLEQPGGGPLLILADEGLDAPALARYVHNRTRAGQPFVAVDCAQASAEALDTTLFGVRARAGAELETLGAGSALLAARRGTVFLEN